MNDQLTITYIPVDKLTHYGKNPRRISQDKFESLQRSLDELTLLQPLVVNETAKGLIVLAGNQRLRAAKELGESQLPCVLIKVDDKKAKQINVRLNTSSGENDNDALAELLTGFDELELDIAGLTMPEFTKLQDGWVDHSKPAKDSPKRWDLDQLRRLHENNRIERVGDFLAFLETL